MVTEADARVLEYGSTIVLVAGGHVTPLASDTLQERRISVVRDGADRRRRGAGAGRRHPHGRHRRRSLVAGAEGGASCSTCAAAASPRTTSGPTTSDPVDYPDTAAAAAIAGGRGEADAAHRHRRRRARLDHRRQQGAGGARGDVPERDAGALRAAAQRRQRAGARLDARQPPSEALAIVDTFIDTPMREARYIRRLAKIRELERAGRS